MTMRDGAENAWSGRGTAPFLYAEPPGDALSYSIETYVDLATGNSGSSHDNSIGGLLVYDASRGNLGITLGLRNIGGDLDIILENGVDGRKGLTGVL